MPFPGTLRTIKDGLLYLFSSIFLPLSISFIMAGRPIPAKLQVFGGGSGESSREDEAPPAVYRPTPTEILAMRRLLGEATGLPIEVIVSIFDFAEYWAHSSNEFDYMAEYGSPCRVFGSNPDEDKFLIRTFPVGYLAMPAAVGSPEDMIWGVSAARPLPLAREHNPTYLADLCLHPTPSLVNPVRKIVFSTRSRDQGWGGELALKGLYKSSWTWFEAGLERFDADAQCDTECTYDLRSAALGSSEQDEPTLPVCGLRPIYPPVIEDPDGHESADCASDTTGDPSPPQAGEADEEPRIFYKYDQPLGGIPRLVIQHNKLATKTWQEHKVTWTYCDDIKPDSKEAEDLTTKGRGRCSGDGSFVRELKLGDVVTVWAKARFPGWENKVEKVKIEVYWAM